MREHHQDHRERPQALDVQAQQGTGVRGVRGRGAGRVRRLAAVPGTGGGGSRRRTLRRPRRTNHETLPRSSPVNAGPCDAIGQDLPPSGRVAVIRTGSGVLRRPHARRCPFVHRSWRPGTRGPVVPVVPVEPVARGGSGYEETSGASRPAFLRGRRRHDARRCVIAPSGGMRSTHGRSSLVGRPACVAPSVAPGSSPRSCHPGYLRPPHGAGWCVRRHVPARGTAAHPPGDVRVRGGGPVQPGAVTTGGGDHRRW